ncbi:hypothetical protein [Salegentibacter mishustinae]|uniref:Uncharacterized protein n=1 Tax=Salegentibacter mishustinae TaxID=270918 RepID=A0A0Q9ZPS8_9FLAO|nr:hypothetical protein [Salegentibacter mishustinae]KRG30568.1 hypothetical protein APR42_01495 [Salegentibacter mishustinae]PNW23457.1 hypothetical protein APB85_01490 [Salegentibacter mishustinae]PZX66527.1 hypothetical protein LY54_00925 [Salegentibacter mishustinae]GGW83059.1 hypothetical protein GCM10008086_08880 [Salegentibacter mishustinae]
MTLHHVDSFQDYTEDEVFASVKNLIKKENRTYTAFQKRLLFADLIKYISTERLLMPTLEVAEDFNFIQDLNDLNKLVETIPLDQDYSRKDLAQLKAIAFSEIILINLFFQQFGRPEDVPELQVSYSNKAVETNSEELLEHLKRSAYIKIAENTVKSGKAAKDKFKAIITSMASIDYANKTEFFKHDKEYLKEIKDNIPEENTPTVLPAQNKTSPSFFKHPECFKLFEDYAANYIIEPYVDYSFIFQQLKDEKLIHPISHKEFILWLKSAGHTTQKENDLLLEKGHFRSLSKSTNQARLNSYYKLKDKYFEND